MIKKLILMVSLVASIFASELHWAKDFNSGIAQATKENKPVLFVISRDTCKYCVMLDEQTLKDEKIVKALNENFISIRSWINEGDYIPADLAKYTPGLPGIWFLTPKGEPMFRPMLGFIKKEKFQEALAIIYAEFKKQKKGTK